jgi:hypothetical protein
LHKTHKFLGVILDQELRWKAQVDYASKSHKAWAAVGKTRTMGWKPLAILNTCVLQPPSPSSSGNVKACCNSQLDHLKFVAESPSAHLSIVPQTPSPGTRNSELGIFILVKAATPVDAVPDFDLKHNVTWILRRSVRKESSARCGLDPRSLNIHKAKGFKGLCSAATQRYLC